MLSRSVKRLIHPASRSLATLSVEANGVVKFDAVAASKISPKATQVVVQVKVAPVTVDDLQHLHGHALGRSKTAIAGSTSVGTVTEAGNAANVRNNDLVLVAADGCWSDHITANKDQVFKLPNLSPEDAASIPVYVAAEGVIQQLNNLKAGDTVLQTNADSVLGKAVSQLAKIHGVNVVNITAAELADIGKMREVKANHAIVGHAAGRSFHNLFRSVKYGGSIVVYNGSTQSLGKNGTINIPVSSSIFNDIRVNGFSYSAWVESDANGFGKAVSMVSKLLEDKKLSPITATVVPIADYKKALSAVENDGNRAVIKF